MIDNLDIDLLGKKNEEIKRQKLIGAGLIIVILGFATVLAFVAILSQIDAPSPTPTISVIKRDAIDDVGSTIRVPDTFQVGDQSPTITAGVPFTYETKGEKLVDNSATVEFQITCDVNGAENIVSVGTIPYSNIPKGKFDIHRSFTIPNNSKVNSADQCKLQSIATYTFYQSTNGGKEQSFEVVEVGSSNYFKLVVPADQTIINVTNVSQTTPKEMTPTSTIAEKPNVAQYEQTKAPTVVNPKPPIVIDPPVQQPETKLLRGIVDHLFGL